MGDLLEKLEARYGSVELEAVETKEYDVLVAGAGPAGATAAIYSARKVESSNNSRAYWWTSQ